MPTLIVSPQGGSHDLAVTSAPQPWRGEVIYKYATPGPLALADVNVGGVVTHLQEGQNDITGTGTYVTLLWQMGSTRTAYIHNTFVCVDESAPHGVDDFGFTDGTFQGLFTLGSASQAYDWNVEVYVQPQDGVRATVNLTDNPDIPQNAWTSFSVNTQFLALQISMPADTAGGVKVEWNFV